jgi:hypothetical protein
VLVLLVLPAPVPEPKLKEEDDDEEDVPKGEDEDADEDADGAPNDAALPPNEPKLVGATRLFFALWLDAPKDTGAPNPFPVALVVLDEDELDGAAELDPAAGAPTSNEGGMDAPPKNP